ncbi:MAG: hypothetical protein ACC642_11395 [Pseudomonadales bacterium]
MKQYDPVADRWTVSYANWGPKFLPEPGSYLAFWTGEAMLVVGVEDRIGQFRYTAGQRCVYRSLDGRERPGVRWQNGSLVYAMIGHSSEVLRAGV